MALYVLEKAAGGKIYFCAKGDQEADRFIREKVFPGRTIHREDGVNHGNLRGSENMNGAER